MSGSALNRGGVKVEYEVGEKKPWRVRTRNHWAAGATGQEAFDALVKACEADLKIAKDARATFLASSITEPASVNPPTSEDDDA
ncbi:MAG: hypothetical protein JO214_07610 [Frankiaceae bacterium]|nr:hypothetical protein [Frankiaceae bacterium]